MKAARALVLLFWTIDPACDPAMIRVRDWYIAPGDVRPGERILPGWHTSTTIAPGKPYPGCAVAWTVEALDATGAPLPAACQPLELYADGETWPGAV